jgi:REP element-mobilizing transposase RayT
MPDSSRNPIGEQLTTRQGQLPHWQLGGSVYFVTFRSARGPLPPEALVQLRSHVAFDHGKRFDLIFGVMMPDHVHLLIKPREKTVGCWYDLAEILKNLKGASSRRINQLLGTSGPIWQKESYDRIVRDDAEFQIIFEYIFLNPQKAGLIADPELYPFFLKPPE